MSSFVPKHFDAVIFDLDGVVTDSAKVHARAWKALFDDYLRDVGGDAAEPFDIASDYRAYVDGRSRVDGVRTFLAARGLTLPIGSPSDGPEELSIWGLGNRKDREFVEALERDGVDVFESTVQLLRDLESAGVRRGVASSSRNCARILRLTGLASLFEVRVDGVTLADRSLPGKPAPDIFLECAALLDVDPRRSVVVEDAVSGVQAARAGGFGLVIGVDRHDVRGDLLAAGADVVVTDLAECQMAAIDALCAGTPADAG